MGQIRTYKVGLHVPAMQFVSVCGHTVAFLDRFSPKLAQT